MRLSNPSQQAITMELLHRGRHRHNQCHRPGAGGLPAVAGHTLTFNPGETNKSVSVTVFGDRFDEPDETFYLVLANPLNARWPRTACSPPSATMTRRRSSRSVTSPFWKATPAPPTPPSTVGLSGLSAATVSFNFKPRTTRRAPGAITRPRMARSP